MVGETRFHAVASHEGAIRFPRRFVQVDTSNYVVHVLELDDTIELAGTEEVSHDGITGLHDETRRTVFLTGCLCEDVGNVRHENDARFALARSLESNQCVRSISVDVLVQLDLAVQERTSVSHTASRLHGSISTEVAVRDVDTVVQSSDSSAHVRRDDSEVTGAHTGSEGNLARHCDNRVHDTGSDGLSSPATLCRTLFCIGEVNHDDLFTTELLVLSNHNHGHEDFTVDVLLDFELEAFEEQGFNVLTVGSSHILLEFESIVALDGASTDADGTRDDLDGGLLDVVAVGTEFVITVIGETTEVVVELARNTKAVRTVGNACTFLSAFSIVGQHFASTGRIRVERGSITSVVSDQVITDFLLLAITEGSRLQRFVIIEVTESEVDALRSRGGNHRNSVHGKQFGELTTDEGEGVLLVLSNISGDVGRFHLGATVHLVLVFKQNGDARGFTTVAKRTTKAGLQHRFPLAGIGLVLDNLHSYYLLLFLVCSVWVIDVPRRETSQKDF